MAAKMSREERAKQFMPFSALKGYSEALRKKEKIVVPQRELSKEYQEELNRKLRRICENDIITVIYFADQEYLRLTGRVSGIDETAGILTIVNQRVAFAELYDIINMNDEDLDNQ